MPRSPYQSNAGPIDTSGIAGLGDFGQDALRMMLGRQQEQEALNLRRSYQATQAANQAAQLELERQIAAKQSEEAEQAAKQQRQGKIIELAKLSRNADEFDALASMLFPDMDPVERNFGRTFADATTRVTKEKEKAAEQQQARALYAQGGGINALAALPAGSSQPQTRFSMPTQPDMRGFGVRPGGPPIGMGALSPVDRAAQETGWPAGALADIVAGRKRIIEEQAAQKAATLAERRAGRRATATATPMGATSGGEYEELVAINGPARTQRLLSGKVGSGVYRDFLDPNVIRQGGAKEMTKDRDQAASLKALEEVDALANILAEANRGGPTKETLLDMGRRLGKEDEVLAAYQAVSDAFIQLRALAVTGTTFTDTQLDFIRRGVPSISELRADNLKAISNRLMGMRRAVGGQYFVGTTPQGTARVKERLGEARAESEAFWRNQLGLPSGVPQDARDYILGAP